jgi:hypothetical protein
MFSQLSPAGAFLWKTDESLLALKTLEVSPQAQARQEITIVVWVNLNTEPTFFKCLNENPLNAEPWR